MSEKKKSGFINKEKLAAGLGKAGKAAVVTGKFAAKVGVAAGKTAYSGAKLAGGAIAKRISDADEKKREALHEEIAESIEAAKVYGEKPSEEPAMDAAVEETELPEEELPEVEDTTAEEADADIEEKYLEEEAVSEEEAEEASEEETTEAAEEVSEEAEDAEEINVAEETLEPARGRDTGFADKVKKLDKRKAIPAALLALLVAGYGAAYGAADSKHFADGTSVNGLDVSDMGTKKVSELMTENFNETSISMDGKEAKKLETAFTYQNKAATKRLIKWSHVDPRRIIGAKQDYTLKLTASDGNELTAAAIEKLYPLEKGEIQTKNAYINYSKMEIVDAVQGTSLDYVKIAEAISAQRESNPTENNFEFAKEDYIAEPSVVAEDLADELEFAKENLAQGMDIIKASGEKVHIGPALLAKIIQYNGGNVEYSEEGAIEVARALSKDYKEGKVTVETQEGKRTLDNYALTGAIDAEKTAESIVKAAKKGEVGRIYADSNRTAVLGDHVEVSLSSQTVYLVIGDKVTYKSPVVTGTAGHRTPPGIFKLAWKASPSVLSGKNDDGSEYENPVNFWMPFNGGIGLHDAPWRGSFGGSIYVYNGSHGCVNMPYDAARTVYNWIHQGDIIVVY